MKLSIKVTCTKKVRHGLLVPISVLDDEDFDIDGLVYDKALKLIADYTDGKYDIDDEAVTGLVLNEDGDVAGFQLYGKNTYFVPGGYGYVAKEDIEAYVKEEKIPPDLVDIVSKHPDFSTKKVMDMYIAKHQKEFEKNGKIIHKRKLTHGVSILVNMVGINSSVNVKKKEFKTMEKVLKNINDKKAALRKKLERRIKQGARINKIGFKVRPAKLFNTTASKIDVNKVTPVTNQTIKKISEIFDTESIAQNIQFEVMSGADMKMSKSVQNKVDSHAAATSTIKVPKASAYKKLRSAVERQKYKYNLYYGCYVVATYFQMLVSNTPMDEEYSYTTKGVVSSKVRRYDENGKLMSAKKITDTADVKVGDVKVTHKPDESYVRGDWVITFRGKKFKAFETKPAKGASIPTYDYAFTKELFEKKVDEESISEIALKIYELTKDNGDTSLNFEKANFNPRWEMLEKGGYLIKGTTPKPGAKYTHGVAETGLTYQAPYGFVALTDATWNMLVNTGAMKGSVSNFINKNMNKLDVSNVNNKIMKKLLQDNGMDDFYKKGFKGVYEI